MLKCKWRHNRQIFYDDVTGEVIQANYAIQFIEDFLGAAGGSAFDGTAIWNVVEVGTSTNESAAIVADSSNGQFLYI